MAGERPAMTGWVPPSIPRRWLAAIVAVYAVVLAYAVLIQGSFLLGALPGVVVAATYVLWRFLVALEAIADGVHRIADGRDGEE
jgi:hypothetical protein